MVITPNYSALLILACLADADMHGYAVTKEVAARTTDTIRLRPTTVYRLIAQLADAGLIEPVRQRARLLDDPRRRTFKVTNAGRRLLAGEMRRLDRVRRAVRPARPRSLRRPI